MSPERIEYGVGQRPVVEGFQSIPSLSAERLALVGTVPAEHLDERSDGTRVPEPPQRLTRPGLQRRVPSLQSRDERPHRAPVAEFGQGARRLL